MSYDDVGRIMARHTSPRPKAPTRAVAEAIRGVRLDPPDGEVVAYLRVSGRAQSTDTQRAAIERLARARGEMIDRWFEESRSARTIERPMLSELRAAITLGAVRTLYIYRIDRLSRTGIRDTFHLVEDFRSRGVQIVTVADGFAMDGVGADIVLAVLAWAAQMEREAIGERISDAHDRVSAAGLPWGRPRRVDVPTALKIASEHRDEGRSVRELAMAYGVPRSTIGRIVSRKPPTAVRSSRPRKKGVDGGASQ